MQGWRRNGHDEGTMRKTILQEKAVETTKEKEQKRTKHKPEEKEGMPQHKHCPLAKHRGDKNPKYHEDQQNTLHEFLPHIPPETPKRNKVVRRTKSCTRT
jgi:hypothetical protein